MARNYGPVIEVGELYQEAVREIAKAAISEREIADAVLMYLMDEPRAVPNVLAYSSSETLDGALERGDGLSQHVCDLAREMMIEEVRALQENAVLEIRRADLCEIITWLGDMTDNAEVDALNESELGKRVEAATAAFELGERLLKGEAC